MSQEKKHKAGWRRVAWVTVAALALTFGTQAYGADAASGAKKMTFWVFQTGAPLDFLSSLPGRYNARNGAKLDIAVESVPFDQYLGTKLTTAFASGEGPDIFLASSGTMSKYIASGIALPLDAYYEPGMKADFGAHGLDSVTAGGKIYGVPMECDLYGLYYDKRVFADAGKNPPRTWKELKETALALKTKTRAGLTIETVKGAYQNCSWYPFLWMAGGDVFNPEHTHSLLGSAGTVKALQYWRDLVDSGATNIKPSRATGNLAILNDGETAMQVGGSWSIASIGKVYDESRIGLVPLPVPEGGSPASVAGGWKLMVSAKGADPVNAAKFAVWAFGKDVDVPLEWVTKIKFCFSPRTSVMSAGKDVYHQGLRSVFTDQIYGTEKPEIRMPPEASSIVEDMIQEAVFDARSDVQKVAAKSQRKMEEFLQEYGSVF